MIIGNTIQFVLAQNLEVRLRLRVRCLEPRCDGWKYDEDLS
jgi:hypothetical protein